MRTCNFLLPKGRNKTEMSTETFLTGSITLKKGVGEKEARKLAADLGDYTEVSQVMAGYVSSDYYAHHLRNKADGHAVIVWDAYCEAFEIRYSDVSWSSHLYDDKWRDIRRKLYQNRELIQEASMSLYYLSEADEDLYFSADAKEEEYGSWREEDKEPPEE